MEALCRYEITDSNRVRQALLIPFSRGGNRGSGGQAAVCRHETGTAWTQVQDSFHTFKNDYPERSSPSIQTSPFQLVSLDGLCKPHPTAYRGESHSSAPLKLMFLWTVCLKTSRTVESLTLCVTTMFLVGSCWTLVTTA